MRDRQVRERGVLFGHERPLFDFFGGPVAAGEGGDVGFRYEVLVGELHAFGEAGGAGGPEDDYDGVAEGGGGGDLVPLQFLGRGGEEVDGGVEGLQGPGVVG